MKWTYLLIDLLSVAVPLACSFEGRIQFVSRWRALFPAMAVVALFFLIWDGLFTSLGVWGFSSVYTLVFNVLGLPIEEMLFFVCIPYCCVFTYEVLNHFIAWNLPEKPTRWAVLMFAVGLALLAAFNSERLYTFWACLFTSAFLLVVFLLKVKWLPALIRAYLVILLPFLIVNGLLTGTGLDEPVVWYNNAENLGIRLLTIPVEDTVYGFLLIGLNIGLYEYLKAK